MDQHIKRVVFAAAIAAPLLAVAPLAQAEVPLVPHTRAETQSGLVEDGRYPAAEEILAERGITLISGNGLIVLASCGSPGLIQIRSSDQGLICFKARTWQGIDIYTMRPAVTSFLKMRIPEVYVIKGDNQHHGQEARLTLDDQTKTYYINPNEWTPVGEGVDPGNPPETLIELRVAEF